MIKTDFSLKECEILMSLCGQNFDNHETLTLTKLARIIRVSVSSPRFWNVIRYLKEASIIQEQEQIGSSKIISLSRAKLEELIYQQELLLPIFKFYEDTHTLIV